MASTKAFFLFLNFYVNIIDPVFSEPFQVLQNQLDITSIYFFIPIPIKSNTGTFCKCPSLL